MSFNSNQPLKNVLLFSDCLHKKFTFILLLIFSHVIWAQDDRLPTDQAYLFSADAETLLGNQPLRTTFSCQGREYGYYADVANNCQVFHICWPISEVETAHWSFFCGNGTIFDQANLVCNFPEASFPCSQAESIYGAIEFGIVDDQDYY